MDLPFHKPILFHSIYILSEAPRREGRGVLTPERDRERVKQWWFFVHLQRELSDITILCLIGAFVLLLHLTPKRLRSTSKSNWPDPEYLVAERRKERKYTSKQLHDAARPYAAEALRLYNKEAGTKYELVEPGYMTSALLRTCILHHIDFTAKKTDVADAPEEMFFAEQATTREDVLEATSGEDRGDFKTEHECPPIKVPVISDRTS
ncbi:hypothetical protein C5167_031125 [Papaver somniferum]|uniref:uncharacterized protein LOC113334003 n=1 Tax=Papaver somniferum TaxID=3469 RepID=UPI000E701C63|nr:uncharacterized protein LOC113334003 [Papaver somniferum]RZC88751.1 hypothetical protein C5167_031125 [Papaver somniferum]